MKSKVESNDRQWDQRIKKGVNLVSFSAPWCAPCRMQGPILEKIAEVFEGKVRVTKINIEKNRKIAEKLNIQSIPTMVLFKNGKEVQRFVGLHSGDILSKALSKLTY